MSPMANAITIPVTSSAGVTRKAKAWLELRGDRFVFGYGMDAKGYWRNLPEIRAMRES